ncbi:MAG: SusC/RagA family TonB-linked outer membrane protein [Flavobacterium sp.]|nr:SusC/RagA family TonB-linked outer membrane protein [Flavobacterium sp.]
MFLSRVCRSNYRNWNTKNHEIVLQENTLKIDEVVVIGYGTQKRSNVTGAVAKIKSEKFETAPVSRLDQALQGKIAGVSVQNVSSEAGADTQVTVRGISSIGSGTGPLIVVDGQPIPDGFGAINNADVESVEVLKDAASAAIYGSRGANGVILITTKSGKDKKTRFNFRSTLGFKKAYDTYDILTSQQYVERLFAEGNLRATDPLWTAAYGNTIPSVNTKWLGQYAIEKDILKGKATDYQQEALRTSTYQDIQLNASGGNKDNKFYISLGYQKDQGLMKKSNFEKLNFRAKYESNLTEKLKLNINLNPSNTKTERPAASYTDFFRFPSFLPVFHTQATADFINGLAPNRNIQVGAFAEDDDFANLVYTGIDPNGNPYTTAANTVPFTTSNTNPVRALTQQNDNENQFRFQGGLGLSYKISKSLEFKTNQNIYFRNSNRLESGAKDATRIGNPNYAIYTNRYYFDFLTENTLNYKQTFEDHELSAVAGFTLQSTRDKRLTTAGNTFPSDFIQNLNFATNISQPIQSDITTGLLSGLGRINYSYKDKILLMASYRTDGSSIFAEGKKWGGFPAVSVGYIISKEDFMANLNFINRLGYRFSYGATGNNNINPFLFQNVYNSGNYVDGNNTVVGGVFDSNNQFRNPDIEWERTFQTNYGLDLALFSNRLNLTVDYYISKTERLLLETSSLLITGSSSFITNAGSLKIKDLKLIYQPQM